jgi:hypothetical protein
MLRIPHCLDNRLINGGKGVSPRTRRTLLHRNIIIFMFLVLISVKMLDKPQSLVRPEGLGKFKNSPHRVSNPRPSGLLHSALTTTLPRVPELLV